MPWRFERNFVMKLMRVGVIDLWLSFADIKKQIFSSRISRINLVPHKEALRRHKQRWLGWEIRWRIRIFGPQGAARCRRGHFWTNKVIKGVKMEIILITWRICMICIWIDCKFDAHSDSVHVKVIWGHLTGSKKVIWGRKSKTRPNAHDMHTIRLEIFLCERVSSKFASLIVNSKGW